MRDFAKVLVVSLAGVFAGCDASIYSHEVLADSPELYLRLGETSGLVAVDSSGNGRDGTYAGGFLLGQPGALRYDPDAAVRFDGTGYVDVGSGVPDALLADATKFVELWVKPSQSKNGLFFLGETAGFPQASSFRFVSGSNGELGLDVSDGLEYSAILLEQGTWNHVFAYWDQAARVNVVGKVTKCGVQREILETMPANNLRAGLVRVAQEASGGYFAAGVFDEVALYAHVLDDERLMAHHQAALAQCNCRSSEKCR